MSEPTQLPAEIKPHDPGLLPVPYAGGDSYPSADDWSQLKEMARMLSVTEFVPQPLRGRPYSVLAALLTGRDLKIPPMASLNAVYVVNGRPGLMSDLKVALARRAGHKVIVRNWTSESCTVLVRRRDDPDTEALEVTYTIQDAKQAGDYDRNPNYKTRPKQMLLWRASGLGVDVQCPDVTLGLPTVEDLYGLPALAQPDVIDQDSQLPAMPTDMALTDGERAAVEGQRQQAAAAAMPESKPPPPPKSTRRGRGPAPNPQQGSDSSGPTAPSGAAPAGSPAPAATPAPATADDPDVSRRAYASDAQMARDLGLDAEAEALERGETVPTTADDYLAGRRGAETASTAPEAPAAAQPPAGPAEAAQPPAAPADDPFASAPADNVEDINGLLGQRQRAEHYAEFLARRKAERDHRSAGSVAELHADALSRLDALSKAMLGKVYGEVTEAELQDKLVPWLRERYAKEGGTE